MGELNLETKNGKIPINQNIVEKYNLKKGTMSSFSSNRIVDMNGEFIKQKEPKKVLEDANEGDNASVTGLVMETSEIIDFAQGSDA